MSLPLVLATGPWAISAIGLDKRYGRHHALQSLDLSVPRGSIFLLVGPNGAGKSSILKILLGLVRPTAGRVSVFDLPLTKHDATIRANIGYVPERNDWSYGWMTVRQALAHHAAYFTSWDAAYAARLIHTFALREDQRLGTLSKGQARRAHLVMALAHRPPLLLLDEPTDGLDPIMRDETLATLTAHVAETETTVLLATHHVSEVERLTDHVGVLANGALRLQASVRDISALMRRYEVRVPSVWNNNPFT